MSALLDNATNLFGKLQPDVRARIVRFLDEPTEANWNGCYCVLISPFTTVWRAMTDLDPAFPRAVGPGPWERIPDALTVARAIRLKLERK